MRAGDPEGYRDIEEVLGEGIYEDPDLRERPEDIEPSVDPDSQELLAEELPEPPHPATEFDAGTGQGTVHPPRTGRLQQRPILDGSTQDSVTESTVPNPHRGQEDPAMMKRQPALNSSSTDRWLVASVIAAAVMCAALLWLLPYNEVWCGIGIIVALVGVIAMLVLRLTRIGLKARLRIDAVLMALVWLVPLAVFIAVLITSSDEIWNRVT